MRKLKLQFKIGDYLAIWLALVLFFFATPVLGAEIFFEPQVHKMAIGEQLEVGLFLNTEDEDINAIEGKIIFSPELLELKEIQDGNSIITFWIESPKVADGNEISFSGIIPGGYSAKKGLIFSMIFQALTEGDGLVEIRGVRVLHNDGKGTEADVTGSNFQFVVSGKSNVPQAPIFKKDQDLPEPFEPTIAWDSEIFDGKYFLVFATQDKQSGVDHYEVREGKRPFVITESPYLLQNQNLNKEIIVKAVDRNGNERTAVLPPPKPRVWYENYAIFVILIISIVFVYIVCKFLWRKIKLNL